MVIELFQSKDGPRWRLRANNGEILATSEAYSDRDKARQTAELVAAQGPHFYIEEVLED